MTKKQNLLNDDLYKYLKGRLDELSQTDNARKYTEVLLPIINILWEQESGLKKGGTYVKEWELNHLKIRVTHNE